MSGFRCDQVGGYFPLVFRRREIVVDPAGCGVYSGIMKRRHFLKIMGRVTAALTIAPTQLLPAERATVLVSPSIEASVKFQAALRAAWLKHTRAFERELVFGAG